MLAKSSPPFDSEKHIFELKWNGTRCIAFIEKGNVRLQNRRLRDITYRYPELRELNKNLRVKSAVIDGELVVLEKGRPDFARFQQREHIIDNTRIEILSSLIPVTYVVFDLLLLNGEPIMKRPLMERRALLGEMFPLRDNVILSESYSDGKKLFKLALTKGFEGTMAKDKGSSYLPGIRSGYWLKIKNFSDIDAVVCGYLEGESSRYFASLIIGAYYMGRLVHIGDVGSGLDEQTMEYLYRRLAKLRTDKHLIDDIPRFDRKAFWCRPEIVIRVKYQEWTTDRKLRSPVFEGVRDDKEPEECVLEDRQ